MRFPPSFYKLRPAPPPASTQPNPSSFLLPHQAIDLESAVSIGSKPVDCSPESTPPEVARLYCQVCSTYLAHNRSHRRNGRVPSPFLPPAQFQAYGPYPCAHRASSRRRLCPRATTCGAWAHCSSSWPRASSSSTHPPPPGTPPHHSLTHTQFNEGAYIRILMNEVGLRQAHGGRHAPSPPPFAYAPPLSFSLCPRAG